MQGERRARARGRGRRGRGRGRGRGRPRARSPPSPPSSSSSPASEPAPPEPGQENEPPKLEVPTDISQLEAPVFTTLHRGPPEPMLRLHWNHRATLIGEKVLNPMIYCCDTCQKPILIYGRMIPCKHVFCLQCARADHNQCPRCRDKVSRVEQTGLGTVFMCTHAGTRYGNAGCRRTYLSQRDLQAHINHRHLPSSGIAGANSDGQNQQSNAHQAFSGKMSIISTDPNHCLNTDIQGKNPIGNPLVAPIQGSIGGIKGLSIPAGSDPRVHSSAPVIQGPPQNMSSHNSGTINVNPHIQGSTNIGNAGPHGLSHNLQLSHLPVRQLAPPGGRTNLITVPIQDHSVPPPSHNMNDMNMPQNYHYPPHGYYPPGSSIPPVMSSPQISNMQSNSAPPMQINSVHTTIGHNMPISMPSFYGVASGPPSGPPSYPAPPVYVSQNNQMVSPVGNMIVSNSNSQRAYDQSYGGQGNSGGGAQQGSWPPQPSQPPPQQHYYR